MLFSYTVGFTSRHQLSFIIYGHPFSLRFFFLFLIYTFGIYFFLFVFFTLEALIARLTEKEFLQHPTSSR